MEERGNRAGSCFVWRGGEVVLLEEVGVVGWARRRGEGFVEGVDGSAGFVSFIRRRFSLFNGSSWVDLDLFYFRRNAIQKQKDVDFVLGRKLL